MVLMRGENMTVSSFGRAVAVSGLFALGVGGCAHEGKPPAPAAAPVPVAAPPSPSGPQLTATPDLDPDQRLRKVVDLLNDGQRDQARVEARQLLKEQPDNAVAANLLNQIDADAKLSLGAQSFPYKVRSGETFFTLAERYLGDRNQFYALARYNGIDAPDQLTAGQTIQIPGEPRKLPPPEPALRRRIEPEPSRGDGARKPAAAPPPAPTQAPAAPVRNPARANSLRSEALVQMNKGSIDKSVALLREAAQLDPDNTAIAADLARAVRIQAVTHK